MIDDGYKITAEDNHHHKNREPITDLGKKHAAQAFALSRDEVLHNPPYVLKCPPPDKYSKDKWQVINGRLVIGDPKRQNGTIELSDGTVVKVKEQSKKHDSKAAWLAKLSRMRRTRPSDDQNDKYNEDKEEPLILDVFGDT